MTKEEANWKLGYLAALYEDTECCCDCRPEEYSYIQGTHEECEGCMAVKVYDELFNALTEPYLHTEELLQKMLTINANNLGSTDARERGAYEIKKAFAEFNGEPCDREMWECGLIKCDHRCGFKEK